MGYTVRERRNNLKIFMKQYGKEYTSKNANGDFVYDGPLDVFNYTRLAEGTEGVVYQGTFKNPSPYDISLQVAIKVIDFNESGKYSSLPSKILKATPNQLYKMFLSSKSFNNPTFIELISATLVNQLVFQNVCPNFTVNYYWDMEQNRIVTYNEFVNYSDFDSWANEHHTTEEWFNALFQIMFGLIALQRFYGMIHADFHTGNVLVMKVQPGGFWEYVIDGVSYYVPNLGYIFLIHDFGYAWIPKKLVLRWYHNEHLKYITKSGMQFFDISKFLNDATSGTSCPREFVNQIRKFFKKEEVSYTRTKRYFIDKFKHMLINEQISKNKQAKIKNELDKYPDIKPGYTGTGATLSDKLHLIFNSHQVNYRTKQNNVMEVYSMDINLDKSKLPQMYANTFLKKR